MEHPSYVICWWSIVSCAFRYRCSVCSRVGADGIDQINHHLKSQQHKKNMDKRAEYYCEICELQCKLASGYNTHINTKRHKQRAGIEPKPEFRCESCDVTFLSRTSYDIHLNTTKHKRNTGLEAKPELKCEPCGVTFLCRASQAKHLLTAKHANLRRQ